MPLTLSLYPIVINNQSSKNITDKAMTGVGITYKFTKLLDKYYKVNYADDYLDLVALGMIGDRADVLNLQTRYLILKGLEEIRNHTNKNKLISTFVEAQMYSMNNNVKNKKAKSLGVQIINEEQFMQLIGE